MRLLCLLQPDRRLRKIVPQRQRPFWLEHPLAVRPGQPAGGHLWATANDRPRQFKFDGSCRRKFKLNTSVSLLRPASPCRKLAGKDGRPPRGKSKNLNSV